MSDTHAPLEQVSAPTRRSIAHVARDPDERPLIGLCGKVCSNPELAPRLMGPTETISCVVCDDLVVLNG